MEPPILLLPSELKHHIAELSSPSSLASLARTHTAYKRVAEQALYNTISLFPNDVNSLTCVETLAMNSEKAAFVRFLTMQFWGDHHWDTRSIFITYLLKALINMHFLSDLRLRSHNNEWIDDVRKILCEGHFRLQTLYCNDWLDCSQIIRIQSELRILGMYTNPYPNRILHTLKQFHDAQLPLPMIFVLTPFGGWRTIDIFPSFYSIDCCATVPQILARCYNEHHQDSASFQPNNVTRVSLYVGFFDMPKLHVFAKDMAVNFPRISALDFFLDRPYEIPSQEMKKFLSFFFNLCQLFFVQVEKSEGVASLSGQRLPEGIKVAHAKEWKVVCPELRTVFFPDGSSLKLVQGEDEWAVTGW